MPLLLRYICRNRSSSEWPLARTCIYTAGVRRRRDEAKALTNSTRVVFRRVVDGAHTWRAGVGGWERTRGGGGRVT
jgi:hypothetical protein